MPLFAGFLLNVFSALFGWLATYLTKKVAIGVAAAATLMAVTVAFYAAIKALVGPALMVVVTNEWFLMGFYACLPSNFEACLTAILVSDLLAFLYRYQLDSIRLMVEAA